MCILVHPLGHVLITGDHGSSRTYMNWHRIHQICGNPAGSLQLLENHQISSLGPIDCIANTVAVVTQALKQELERTAKCKEFRLCPQRRECYRLRDMSCQLAEVSIRKGMEKNRSTSTRMN